MGYNKQAWTLDTRLQADTISLSCYLKDVYTKVGILSRGRAYPMLSPVCYPAFMIGYCDSLWIIFLNR